MEINKLPVLSGYVACISTISPNKVNHIAAKFFNKSNSHKLNSMISLIAEVKCPLFVELVLLEHGLSCKPANKQKLEAFIPTIEQIAGPDINTNQSIQYDIEQTINALLLNTIAYQKDGCDRFIAQVVAPISTYTTVLVAGTLDKWIKLCRGQNYPRPIQLYVDTIKDMLTAELNYLKDEVAS